MKKGFIFTLVFAFVLVLGSGLALAKEEKQAILSKKCDAKKLKEIGGEAIVKVEKGAWEGGYNVTLKTDKMSWNDLMQKMAKAECN